MPYLEDEEATDFMEKYLRVLHQQAVVFACMAKFKKPTGTGDDYCKPFMCFFNSMPTRKELDVHPAHKYVNFKKAMAAGYMIFYWPQFKDVDHYSENEMVKMYMDGIHFHANRVGVNGTEHEKIVCPKFVHCA